ncbi:telomere repeat binding factor-domain-containing protein, partial [Chaetomium sp. MPI-SDFR-AT-0129]
MADTSELEAELLAALGAPGPAPPVDIPTQSNAQPQQPSNDAAGRPSLSHVVSPTSTEPLPPAPTTVTSAPAAAAPVPAPVPSAVNAPLPTMTSPLDSRAAPDATPKASTPTLHKPQLPPQNTLPPQPNAGPQQPQPPTSTALAQEMPGARSPKRPRSPDGTDESNIKRQRTDQPSHGPDATGTQSIDFAALLNDALANFDQHTVPEDGDIAMPDIENTQPAEPETTATPEADKEESKIMKASSNPFYVMRSMSLPVLGNIAVQILLRLSQQSRAETDALLADTASEFRRSYDMLRDMFRETRKAFSDSPLLSPDELDITDSEDRETIRMSNLAAAAASVFGAHDVAAHDVHEVFLSIFIPEDGEYKASVTDLFVSLKTRMLLDALNKTEPSQPLSQLLDSLFPVNFEEIVKQRSGEPVLNGDEEVLVAKIRERREQLVKSAADDGIKRTLEEQSSSSRFAESLSSFLEGHLGIVVDYAEKYGVNIPLNEEDTIPAPDPRGAQPDDNLVALLQSHLGQTDGDLLSGRDGLLGAVGDQNATDDEGLALRKLIEDSLSHVPDLKIPSADMNGENGTPDFDSKNLASFISEKLKTELDLPHGLPNLLGGGHSPNVHPQYPGQPNQGHSTQYPSYPQGAPTVGANGDLLPPNQSMPTAALYEKARQAAVAKSSNTTRREGLHSTRRPWTPEEEKALMAGLDMVKGPHWSQILSLFGPQGTISDILKDRTQVQLKDKARNLKLFFLKTNSEMPYYLQSVTGELKTRAPGQAARKEAEEKARMNTEEERARVQGIFALAGGLQNNHHPITNAQLGPPKRVSPSTPGFGGIGAGAGSQANGAVAGMPRIKTEASDQSALHKVTAFPPIQPAPAPGSAVQQARSHLPALQPQGQPGQQQGRPQMQQQYQPLQQPQKPQQADGHRPPAAGQPRPQQQQGQMQQTQQQSAHPARPSQPQSAYQSTPQPHHPGQPGSSQPRPHSQAPRPTTAAPPQSSQPIPQQTPQTQTQPAQHRAPPANAQQAHPPSPAQNQAHAQPQSHAQAQPAQPVQPLQTPPIPPNHHSTPDHAQDTKLLETLKAAIAASTASEGQAQ